MRPPINHYIHGLLPSRLQVCTHWYIRRQLETDSKFEQARSMEIIPGYTRSFSLLLLFASHQPLLNHSKRSFHITLVYAL